MSFNLLQQEDGKKVNTVVDVVLNAITDAVVNAVTNMAQQLIT